MNSEQNDESALDARQTGALGPAPVDVSALPAAAARILDPKTPAPLRQIAAKGFAPGLKPHEALAVVVLLSNGSDESAAVTAKATLEKIPDALLAGAATKDLDPGVLDVLLPLYAEINNMTVSQKIRRAMLGSKSDRMILVRDSNRLVAEAAVKSPMIQEGEIAMVSQSRTVSDGVLRIIALDREWTRSNQIRFNLVANPRTPFAFVARLLPMLREHDLKAISKNKNVPGNVQQLAKQQLLRRGGK